MKKHWPAFLCLKKQMDILIRRQRCQNIENSKKEKYLFLEKYIPFLTFT